MKTLLALVLCALVVGCDESEPEPEMAELEANGDTVERACFSLASRGVDDNYSEAAHELADEAIESCGPAPVGDTGSVTYGACLAEQCNCSGVDPSTGAQVCE
jgi:hypothetical protein